MTAGCLKEKVSKGWFVTGTDTGVGKTVVSAALGLALLDRGIDVGVLKPVETGCRRRGGRRMPQDAVFLKELLGLETPLEAICPTALGPALAPAAAAAAEGVRLDPGRWRRAFDRAGQRHDRVLVEGAGGLMVPLTDRLLISDLARQFALPVVLVARSGLGTINHTLLSLEHARARGLDVAGIVFKRHRRGPLSPAERSAPVEVGKRTPVPVAGLFPFLETVDRPGLLRAGRRLLKTLEAGTA